jgi:hypothetical protein
MPNMRPRNIIQRNAGLLWAFACWLSVGICLPSGAATISFKGFTVTNETGTIIVADDLRAGVGYDRDRLRTVVTMEIDNTSGLVPVPYWVRLTYTFEDQAGERIPFTPGTGGRTLELVRSNAFNVPAGQRVRLPIQEALAPAVRLDPSNRYQLRLRYESSLLRLPGEAVYGPVTWLHFVEPSPQAGEFNLVAQVHAPVWSSTTAPSFGARAPTFEADVPWNLWRYDQLQVAPQVTAVPAFLRLRLLDVAAGTEVELREPQVPITNVLATYVAGAVDQPASATGSQRVAVSPLSVLDAARDYALIASIGFSNRIGATGELLLGNSVTSAPVKLKDFHFTGRLDFGEVITRFTQLDGLPVALPAVAGPPRETTDWTLRVVDQSGRVEGVPDYTYGKGQVFRVVRLANGDARFSSVPYSPLPLGPALNVLEVALAPDTIVSTGRIAGVRFERRGEILLDEASARAETVRVWLPAGFGWREDAASRVLHDRVVFTNAPLGALLLPKGPHVLAQSLAAAVDSKPLVFVCSGMVWMPEEGTFLLTTPFPVHAAVLEYAHPDGATKKSNTKHYHFVDTLRPSLAAVVRTTPNGIARLTADVEFKTEGAFTAHFPYGAEIAWTQGGHLEIRDDLPVGNDPTTQLGGVIEAGAFFERDCDECDGAGAGPDTPRITPQDGRLRFTRDGGLIAGGSLVATNGIQWGFVAATNDFAHNLGPATSGTFHMPGHHLRGDQSGLSEDLGGAVLLLSGMPAGEAGRVERPDADDTENQSGYLEGRAEYAGVNIATARGGPQASRDLLSGLSTSFQLSPRSKYYARASGVSGIHEAAPGTDFENLRLYGYPTQLRNLSLAYLSNDNTDSRTEGEIAVPAPSRFVQEMEEIRFTCTGGLEEAVVPENDPERVLEYWRANFDTLSISFAQPDFCDPTTGYLVLGVEAHAAPLSESLVGELGFLPDGNLISPAEGVALGIPEVTSRLKLATAGEIEGPGDEVYRFTPVQDAYLNDARTTDANTTGWMNLAGTLDVSFFEDMKVHLQTAANSASTHAPYFFMGGWPDDTGSENFGWQISGNDFFSPGLLFDDSHRGYPSTSATVDAYRDQDTEEFNPRAYQTLFGLIPLRYGLRWDGVIREFESFEPKTLDLFVLNTYNAVERLTPEHTELRFGIVYEGLPVVDLEKLFQPLGQLEDKVADAVADAITEFVRDQIEQGLGELDRFLSDRFEDVTEPILDNVVEPAIEELYRQLQTAYATATNWPAAMAGTVSNQVHQVIRPRLQDLVYTTAGTDSVNLAQQLDSGLGKIEAAIEGMEAVLKLDGGRRGEIGELASALIESLSPEYASAYDTATRDEIIEDREPTLESLNETLERLHSTVSSMRSTLGDPAGLAKEMDEVLGLGGAEIDQMAAEAADAVTAWLGSIDEDLGSPFEQYTEEEIIDRIRSEISDRFHALNTTALLQGVLKEWLQDLNLALRSAISSVFDQVNGVIRDILNPVLGTLEKDFNDFLSDLEGPIKHASLKGFADIHNDAIDYLRLDAKLQADFAAPFEFDGFLEIKALDSTGAGAGCYTAGDPATEVTMGANDVSVAWMAEGMRANVSGSFTLRDNLPIGMGGAFELVGRFPLETVMVTDLGAAAAFGAEENYISGTVGIEFNGNALQGGVFLGRTCSLEPLELWAPSVAQVIGPPPFTGAYAYGEASFPITQLLGIPATCLLDITISAGAGVGFFLEGPTFVGTIYGGVNGRVLCLTEVGGDVTLSGAKVGSDYNFFGQGTVYGKFGICPICVKGSKSLTLEYTNGNWDYSFGDTQED